MYYLDVACQRGVYRKGIRAVSQPADASVQYC